MGTIADMVLMRYLFLASFVVPAFGQITSPTEIDSLAWFADPDSISQSDSTQIVTLTNLANGVTRAEIKMPAVATDGGPRLRMSYRNDHNVISFATGCKFQGDAATDSANTWKFLYDGTSDYTIVFVYKDTSSGSHTQTLLAGLPIEGLSGDRGIYVITDLGGTSDRARFDTFYDSGGFTRRYIGTEDTPGDTLPNDAWVMLAGVVKKDSTAPVFRAVYFDSTDQDTIFTADVTDDWNTSVSNTGLSFGNTGTNNTIVTANQFRGFFGPWMIYRKALTLAELQSIRDLYQNDFLRNVPIEDVVVVNNSQYAGSGAIAFGGDGFGSD